MTEAAQQAVRDQLVADIAKLESQLRRAPAECVQHPEVMTALVRCSSLTNKNPERKP